MPLLNEFTIQKNPTFKTVITDRHHGTIFSAMANTPVIVINSADHKLSSGVNRFPQEEFVENVQFAKDLDDAYAKAKEIFEKADIRQNPPYFKDNY